MEHVETEERFGFDGQGRPRCADNSRSATTSAVFLVGLLALPFAPETKGQPLPG